MQLDELNQDQIMTELRKEFSQSQLNIVNEHLTTLMRTSDTLEQLVARVYETANVEIEERQVKENPKINRLDTRKDRL